MEAASSPLSMAQSNSNLSVASPQHKQRPRRGRGQARGGESSSLSFRPASVVPVALDPVGEESRDGSHSRRGGAGRGRGRGRARGGQPINDARTMMGRSFGGQLTREDPDSMESLSQGSLHAAAPVFIPGQQHIQNVTQIQAATKQSRSSRPQKRRMSKSQAADIATRTHEDIDNGHYECAICTSEVLRNSKVWSCHTCWTVFHLKCIKQWSSNSGSSSNQNEPQSADLPPQPRQWRCPGCNLPKDSMPTSYTCWCEKETDPRAPSGLPPHSCGQTCAKERVRKCPHPCQLTCHAGPCPPCSHLGPTQSCFCGKHESTKRCAETDYTDGWSCGDICGIPRACGHNCDRPCHDGDCGPCEVRLPARCYCGQMDKEVLCSELGESKESAILHQDQSGQVVEENWTGGFICGNPCNRAFDCGVHICKSTCHAQNSDPSHCPRSPDVVTHCSCGKTSLAKLTMDKRQTCEDAVPSCDKPCGKQLLCGHACPQVCHSGACPPCRQTMMINCRCGRTESNTICHQGWQEVPHCRRVCRANLSCGRHMCDERCCAGERKAVERLASKKKQRPLNSAPRAAEDGFEAEHICTRQCERALKCGNHLCEELCHRGPCGSCREAIFDEISCNCGRTMLQPPLPCGTQPPPCRELCERPKFCGHPQVAHNCHMGDQTCPKCPFLVEKRCMCGKKLLKNQQCWLRDVSCGEVCRRKLRCGVHYCQSRCHRSGECEDAHGACHQQCGKEKKICGHPDEAPCHAPYPCKEEKPCVNKIFITCVCQAQKQEVRCGASRTSEGNNGKSLPCNDECARLERNRKLALALNIDQSTHIDGGDHVPYSNETLSIFAQHIKWAQAQEREFRVFAASEDEKRLRFKPMQAQQRTFIHSLAEDFGLDSESVDPEPHRHVMIWKTPRFVSAPNKTLADALRVRQQPQRSVNTSANVSDTEGAPVSPKPKSLDLYNSFRITKPRFGLTIDEVRAEVDTVLHPSTPFVLDIEFLPNEDIVLKAICRTLSSQELERMLQNLKMPLATAITAKGYGTTQLCATDSSLNITRHESDSTGGDGWSRVAAKKAAPRINIQSSEVGTATNAFAPLTGGKVTFAKRKTVKAKVRSAPIVDDWEAAETAEEEKETAGSASDDDAGDISAAATDDEGHVKTDEPGPAICDAAVKDWASDVEYSAAV